VITTIPAWSGYYEFHIRCWAWGDSVQGDRVWYKGDPADAPGNGQWYDYTTERGWVAGYLLNTGHDPRAGVPGC
jgi:hypothetical protein